MVDSVSCLRYAVCSRAPDYATNIGFLGRWGTYACPQCLPSGTVPIRSWTRTLRRPGIRHRHHSTIPYHTIPVDVLAPWPLEYAVLLVPLCSVQFGCCVYTIPNNWEVDSVQWIKGGSPVQFSSVPCSVPCILLQNMSTTENNTMVWPCTQPHLDATLIPPTTCNNPSPTFMKPPGTAHATATDPKCNSQSS